ncbi:hypothetical protein ACJX0J_027527, partial [Zea mays]
DRKNKIVIEGFEDKIIKLEEAASEEVTSSAEDIPGTLEHIEKEAFILYFPYHVPHYPCLYHSSRNTFGNSLYKRVIINSNDIRDLLPDHNIECVATSHHGLWITIFGGLNLHIKLAYDDYKCFFAYFGCLNLWLWLN